MDAKVRKLLKEFNIKLEFAPACLFPVKVTNQT